jgi:putative heme-binding domain-containing protein
LTEQLHFALHRTESEPSAAVHRPASEDEWRRALEGEGNVDAGRRLFFHPAVGCARCHRIEDYGGSIGPDLSTIARAGDRQKLIQSVLNPSREIAPQFVQHTVETQDQSYAGLLSGRERDGSTTLILADGKGVFIPGNEIVSNSTSTVSLMPAGLENAMTVQDFRDLLAFMSSLK